MAVRDGEGTTYDIGMKVQGKGAENSLVNMGVSYSCTTGALIPTFSNKVQGVG